MKGMTGMVNIPLVPMWSECAEQHKMVSQLLFGERMEILDVSGGWLLVRNHSDNCTGWIEQKMVKMLNADQSAYYSHATPHCVSVPLLLCRKENGDNILLPGGSLLPDYSENVFFAAGERFVLKGGIDLFAQVSASSHFSVGLASLYLNAPFLTGGKTIFGIDAPGLVQVVYSIGGASLPRDVAGQVECGETIDFLSEAVAGDLAFFDDAEGGISHVGILLNSRQIIHSCGWVRVDAVDNQGIISAQTKEYTHRLRVVKRVV